MKLKFAEKLKNVTSLLNNQSKIINVFDEEPSISSLAKLRQSYTRNDESRSLFSTGNSHNINALGASFSSKAGVSQSAAMNTDTMHMSKNSFQTIDHSISQLQHKLSIQTRTSMVAPRTVIAQTDAQRSRNKIKKKLFQLNNDYFNQTNRCGYMNKPMVRLDLSLFSIQTLSQSLDASSPTKKIHRKHQEKEKDLGDLSDLPHSKFVNKRSTVFSKQSVINGQASKKPIGLFIPKQREKEGIYSFLEYYTKGNKHS